MGWKGLTLDAGGGVKHAEANANAEQALEGRLYQLCTNGLVLDQRGQRGDDDIAAPLLVKPPLQPLDGRVGVTGCVLTAICRANEQMVN